MYKKAFFVTAAALILGAMSAAAQAVITFKEVNHNFGKFSEDKVQSVEFTFTNTGDQPLVIQQTIASCGCTVPSYSQEPIAPGKKGSIKVEYNGRGKFPGEFKKTISVRTNASNSLVRLFIEGNMEASTEKKN